MITTTATRRAALAMGAVAPTLAIAKPEPTTITKTTVSHNNHQVTRKTVVRHTTCKWEVRNHKKIKVCR